MSHIGRELDRKDKIPQNGFDATIQALNVAADRLSAKCAVDRHDPMTSVWMEMQVIGNVVTAIYRDHYKQAADVHSAPAPSVQGDDACPGTVVQRCNLHIGHIGQCESANPPASEDGAVLLFHELYERSKDDRAMIVGSEVREVIGQLRRTATMRDEHFAEIKRAQDIIDGLKVQVAQTNERVVALQKEVAALRVPSICPNCNDLRGDQARTAEGAGARAVEVGRIARLQRMAKVEGARS